MFLCLSIWSKRYKKIPKRKKKKTKTHYRNQLFDASGIRVNSFFPRAHMNATRNLIGYRHSLEEKVFYIMVICWLIFIQDEFESKSFTECFEGHCWLHDWIRYARWDGHLALIEKKSFLMLVYLLQLLRFTLALRELFLLVHKALVNFTRWLPHFWAIKILGEKKLNKVNVFTWLANKNIFLLSLGE
jgi:hypothetical protein